MTVKKHLRAQETATQNRLPCVRELGRGAEVACHGQRHVLVPPDRAASRAAVTGDGTVLAPMPGTVLEVRVSVGQRVVSGDFLGVMEAMKMEVTLKPPAAAP
jgi:acetyl-CoA/propionyl-CoA carboxylase, biotin carboxylase, biotin carboxyl carrier protein